MGTQRKETDMEDQRKQQRVDVALTFATSYKEWKEGTLQRINIKRAVELTNELFDELDKGN